MGNVGPSGLPLWTHFFIPYILLLPCVFHGTNQTGSINHLSFVQSHGGPPEEGGVASALYLLQVNSPALLSGHLSYTITQPVLSDWMLKLLIVLNDNHYTGVSQVVVSSSDPAPGALSPGLLGHYSAVSVSYPAVTQTETHTLKIQDNNLHFLDGPLPPLHRVHSTIARHGGGDVSANCPFPFTSTGARKQTDRARRKS